MKELLTIYQQKYKTINEMIRNEIDVEILAKLNTRSICYREFISELEQIIKKESDINISTRMDMFINSFMMGNNLPYPIKRGEFPYIGKINYEKLTPITIITMIYEKGRDIGIIEGNKQKISEIKKVLDINDED